MTRLLDGLLEHADAPQLAAKIREEAYKRDSLFREARSHSHALSVVGQVALAEAYRLTLPMRARSLPRELLDLVTNIRPVGPLEPTRCLRCGGKLADGMCAENRYIQAKVDGHRRWQRCQAEWRVR